MVEVKGWWDKGWGGKGGGGGQRVVRVKGCVCDGDQGGGGGQGMGRWYGQGSRVAG